MERFVFYRDKLKKRIIEKYGTYQKYAKYAGISPSSLSKKLSGKRYFTHDDIIKAVILLELENVDEYFFKLRYRITDTYQ